MSNVHGFPGPAVHPCLCGFVHQSFHREFLPASLLLGRRRPAPVFPRWPQCGCSESEFLTSCRLSKLVTPSLVYTFHGLAIAPRRRCGSLFPQGPCAFLVVTPPPPFCCPLELTCPLSLYHLLSYCVFSLQVKVAALVSSHSVSSPLAFKCWSTFHILHQATRSSGKLVCLYVLKPLTAWNSVENIKIC